MIWALIPIMALTIPIVAIVAGTIVKPWLDLKRQVIEAAGTASRSDAAAHAAQVARLEQRVRVLERIVTDRGLALGDEIERLRLDAPPHRAKGKAIS